MNSRRRAELQRKLSMGAVPRPPAGLAERIKADIPKHLEASPDPRAQRFAWGNTMRIAATLVTLLATALVTLELLEQKQKAPAVRSAQRENVTPAVLRYSHPESATASTAAPARAETQVSLDIAQELPAATAAAPQAVAPERRNRESDEPATGASAAAGNAPVLQIADAVASAPPPPPPSPMATAPAPAPAPAPMPASAAAESSVEASEELPLGRRPALAPQASARSRNSERTDVFGISLDPAAFPAIRNAIESGTRPAPGTVNVEALVNYFAGAQSSRREVSLEVEASPAPIAVEGDVALLRFTVDTARVDVPERASTPAAARDAHLHVDIDARAVASFRRIGDSGTEESEEALLHNTSVTGLYELQLKPNLRASQRVATVTLQYVSVNSGRKQTISRIVRGADLAKSWDRASRRHRLAALGAMWSETLRGTEGGVEVAKRAEELATQNPADTRARELATAATLSTGGGR